MSLLTFSILSYLLGSIPFSYLIGKLYGKNLHELGSGNVGTANVWRATGKLEPTILALIGDSGKGFLAMFLTKKFFYGNQLILAQILSCFFVVLGHNWPLFLKFKGGRGLATLAGILLYLDWQVIILVLLTLGLSIFLTELIMKKKIELKGRWKEKIKGFFQILISQILGRMIGIGASFIIVFILKPKVIKIIFPAVILTVLKHLKRTKKFLEKR